MAEDLVLVDQQEGHQEGERDRERHDRDRRGEIGIRQCEERLHDGHAAGDQAAVDEVVLAQPLLPELGIPELPGHDLLDVVVHGDLLSARSRRARNSVSPMAEPIRRSGRGSGRISGSVQIRGSMTWTFRPRTWSSPLPAATTFRTHWTSDPDPRAITYSSRSRKIISGVR